MSEPLHVTLIDRDGATRVLPFRPHETLMLVAVRHAVKGIEARCGGACACATCAVEVAPAWAATLDAMGADERDMLEFTGRDVGAVRLSCQLRLDARHDGLTGAVVNNDIA